jgi:hypothetical protein
MIINLNFYFFYHYLRPLEQVGYEASKNFPYIFTTKSILLYKLYLQLPKFSLII